jgi:hypothetical protein
MAHRKTAITVPKDVLAAIDADAKLRGESRSRYIVRILRAAMKARRDAELTRRLKALFADPAFAAAYQRDAELWSRLPHDWLTDERW